MALTGCVQLGRSRIGGAANRALWIALSLAALGSAVARADEPTRIWHTLTTPHFYVHYYRSIRHDEADVAQRVAHVAERVHRVLVPVMRSEPSGRVHIVITDDNDSANGSAQNVPYNVVRILVSAPGSRTSLNDHDDWLFVLLMHEYTHILHIDKIGGIPRIFNWLFGKTWAPNQLQPRWFIEGLAVHQETRRTGGGRNRSAVFDMLLRMAVLEHRFLDIAQISSPTRIRPRGTVPYLYGGAFMEFIADRYGDRVLEKIAEIYGSDHPVPYAINLVASEVTGKTYVEIYREFKQHVQRRYELQKAAIERRGMTRAKAITTHGWSVKGARFSPDGRELVYIVNDGRHHPKMQILDGRTGRRTWDRYHLGGESVSFTPDRRYLVYDRGVNWRTFHNYHDLWVLRRSDRRTRRLTDGMRAREPSVSPDGKQVAFVANELGVTRVALVPLSGGRPRVVVRGHRGGQFFTPRWDPSGRRLVVSHWRAGGRRDIELIDLATGELQSITDDRAIDMDPVFSSDGQRIYFSSDRSGIFNIYRYDLRTRKLEQVTNVLGGAFSPAVSPDERMMYFVGYRFRGYDLYAMELRDERMLDPLPYVDARPVVPHDDGRSKRYEPRRYNPLWTLYPRNWFFDVGSGTFGTRFGLLVQGADAIDRHSYSGRVSVDTGRGDVSYSLHYSYKRFWPSFKIDTSRGIGARGGLEIDGVKRQYIEDNFGLGAELGLPVLRMPDHGITIDVGYRINWFSDADNNRPIVKPGELSPELPEVGRLAGFTTSITYRNTERYLESISNERGRIIDVRLRVDAPALGSDFQSTQVSWSWAEYIDNPWVANHVLALRYAGGVAHGDLQRRGVFFVGGFPRQNIIDAVLQQAPLGGSYLRGYAPGSFFGNQFHLLNVEYRFPVISLETGLGSLPLYFNYVHAAAFVDVGNAFFGDFKPKDLNVGVGAQLLLEFHIGYFVPLTFQLGYARGLMEDGSDEFIALLGNRF